MAGRLLFDDQTVLASSRRDLFSSGIEAAILPGSVYKRVVLDGAGFVLVEVTRASLQMLFVVARSEAGVECPLPDLDWHRAPDRDLEWAIAHRAEIPYY